MYFETFYRDFALFIYLFIYIRKLCKTAVGPHHRASLQTAL
jgi:hypothetical protein